MCPMDPDIYFRHDRIRPQQEQLVSDIHTALKEKKNIVIHAPTGLGKTDSALAPAITYALKNDLTIFFLTPKISQHRIAIEVVRGIAKKYSLPLRAVDMIGRRYACIDSSLADLDQDAFYQSCSKKRKKEQCDYYGNAKGYSKVQESKANYLYSKALNEYGVAKDHNELVALGEKHFACPYEWMIKLASQSNVIVADYFQLLVPSVRDVFLQKIKKKLENSIIIIDEAHNLPKRVRDQLSSAANSFTFKRTESELKLFEDQPFRAQMGFDKWAHALLKGEKEKLVFKHEFNEFLKSFNYTIEDLADYLESVGEEFIEKTNKKSAALKLSKFIKAWQVEEKTSVRILQNKGTYFSLSKRYLDPAEATDILNHSYATIAMSGTLLPLDMHRDLLGLDQSRTILKKYLSPFDSARTINIIAKGTTTKYTSRNIDNYKSMAAKIDAIVKHTPGGTALFFPSYGVMNNLLPFLKSVPLIIQKESMNPKDTHELVRRFTNKEGILCAVQGGSLSEGLDYSQGQIQTAIIIGVALEEMSLEVDALISYFQEKYQKGWEYGYTYPAVIKALQAAGRGIRKESDRCALVFMDERFNWKNYQSALDGRRFIVTDSPEEYVKEFWKEEK